MATQRCSSSLLGDELLQIFVNFVNSEAYGPTALADAFVEIEGRRRQAAGAGAGVGVGIAAGVVTGTGTGAMSGGDDSLRGRAAAAATVVVAAKGLTPRPVEGAEAPTSSSAVPPSSYPFRVSNSTAGGGGVLLLSASPPFLSVDRRPGAAGAAGLAARAGGRAEDDAMASLRRLIGLWLFFHEMVRSSSLAKVEPDSIAVPRVFLMQLSCRCSAIGSGTAMSGGRARAPSTCSLGINSRRNTRITSTFSVFFFFCFCFFRDQTLAVLSFDVHSGRRSAVCRAMLIGCACASSLPSAPD